MARKEYYNAQEAMQRLGLSKSTFYQYVTEGRIKKYLPPHRKRGAFFLAKEIDEMAAALHGFVAQYSEESEKTIVRVARPEDAPEMSALSRRVMEQKGGHGTAVETLLPFLKLPNSEIGHVVIREGRLVGYFTVLPLKHELLMRRMRREIQSSEIKAEETAPFEPGEPIDCYIWELITDPDHKQLGVLLIGKMLTFLHALGKRGVEINALYATATSREGIELCRRIGMHSMNLSSLQPNWIPFEMIIQEETKNRYTRNYKQALKSYKNRHRNS